MCRWSNHGNRAASSKVVCRRARSAGRGHQSGCGCRGALRGGGRDRFLFAPVFHPAFRFTGPPRKELGVPTVFNVLGPLTNPAQPRAGLDRMRVPRPGASARAVRFADQGSSVLVVRGDDGLDELTTTGTSTVWQVAEGMVTQHRLDPAADLGISRVELSALQGGDAGQRAWPATCSPVPPGRSRDAVLLNAGGRSWQRRRPVR